MTDEERAAEALATVQDHQDRARRAARLPWWVYLVIFVVTAGFTAVNDFVDLDGGKFVAGVVLGLLLIALAVGARLRSAPLSHARGVQQRQEFVPWVFVVVAVVGGAAAWLLSRYGTDAAADLAGALGLRDYPYTVAGVLFGLAFTLLFALSQALLAVARRRGDR
ncbi:hypothetical protein [Amycolatopsis rubida]|uniref:Uncharacterized protein n=1 Tax=Amycolatopsis rubida TaxID=112413 RepID=A0A1I5ZXN9_9PSEU|nr:hypothetical protein [Amycolatopsis rubida]SFQ61236.1 hypothetical protein SAMN05421854_116189 [Amycolatopsis rubida]